MNRDLFPKRLRQALDDNGFSQAELLRRLSYSDVKFNKSDIAQYLSGTFIPRDDKLCALATALNVSEGWLAGYGTELSAEEERLVNCYRQATDSERETIAFILRNYGMSITMPSTKEA